MLLDKKPNFTFVEIAAEWARELDDAKNPGRLNRNEIFLNMVRRVWRGDFEDEEGENTCLTMTMPPARQPGGKWVDEHHQRTKKPRKIIKITRRELLYILWSDCPPGVTLPPRQRLSPFPDPETGEPPVPWSELKIEIPWGALDALTLDEYSPTFLECNLGPLTIPKDVFGRWCDEQGHQRPQFWFGKQADARAVPPEPAVIAGIAEPPEPGKAEHKPLDKHQRSRNVETEALFKNHIEAVLAKAKGKWPDPESWPSINEMAKQLVKGQPKSKVEGFGQEAIRKILAGTYKPAKNRSIPGLSSG